MDSSAARGMLNRRGNGKVKHLEVRALWMQDAVSRGIFAVQSVSSELNCADLGTKVLTVSRLRFLRALCGIRLENDEMIESSNANLITTTCSAGIGHHCLQQSLIQQQRARHVHFKDPD